MRIVNNTCYDVSSIPREGCLASILRAPHLITAVNLKDAHTTLGTRLRLALDQSSCRLCTLIAGVRGIAILSLHRQAVRACILCADAALVGSGEIAAASLSRALLNELAHLLHCAIISIATFHNI